MRSSVRSSGCRCPHRHSLGGIAAPARLLDNVEATCARLAEEAECEPRERARHLHPAAQPELPCWWAGPTRVSGLPDGAACSAAGAVAKRLPSAVKGFSTSRCDASEIASDRTSREVIGGSQSSHGRERPAPQATGRRSGRLGTEGSSQRKGRAQTCPRKRRRSRVAISPAPCRTAAALAATGEFKTQPVSSADPARARVTAATTSREPRLNVRYALGAG